ncbi:hypothetical protein GCM10009760_12530 [Kitasatospora kazusensis]|uniref:DUF11 domain-containing protein n=1 Tax=Kitasatospora kazusensis TaxID=407974 RepID=A0ABP5KQQ0_9ACTN
MLRATIAVAVTVAVGATLGAAPAKLPSDSDLAVVRLDPAPAAPGGSTTVHGFVANLGPDRTASPFTVLIDVPAGFTLLAASFPTDCVTSAAGHLVRCTFPPGLPWLRTATVLAPVQVGRDVPHGTVAEGHVRVFGLDDRHPENNSTPFSLTVS